MSLIMELRREPFKASQDFINNPESLVITRRRTSMSCTRLAPTPQMDIAELQKLVTPKAIMIESPTKDRVESPELDFSMNMLGAKKPNRSILKRKSFLPRSLRTRRSKNPDPQTEQSGSRFNLIKWFKKIKGESKLHGCSMKGTPENVVQVQCNGAWNQTPSFPSQYIYASVH